MNSVQMGIYSDLSVLYGPHFVRSVLQNCSPNIFPYGPHNWSITAYYSLLSRFPGTTDAIQGVPKKMTKFFIEITQEIFGLENRFRYFCEAGTCNYMNQVQNT